MPIYCFTFNDNLIFNNKINTICFIQRNTFVDQLNWLLSCN